MNARTPPDDRQAKEGAPDEILIAPPEDRDPPDDRPGQKTADPKEDPTSSKSKKKAPSRKRFRLEQDPGGPVEAPGEPTLLDNEAPMNALSPTRAKKATSTKAATTKLALPQRVTKPEVQRHHNLSATVVRGPKVEHGEVRWYWRIDRCANPALGVDGRETVYHKWATVTEIQTELADLVVRGAHRAQVAVGGRRIVTFADLIDADAVMKGEPAHLNPQTIANWSRKRRWLKAQLGHKIILQTSKDELERLLIAHIQGGRAHSTVSRAAEMLIGAWRWAYDERIVTVRPPKLALGRAFGEPKLTPSRAEINAIVKSLEGEEQLVVEVLAVTGARIGEVVALRRCDYDPRSHCLTVNGKTGPRRVPMDESVRVRLAERADGTTAPLFNWTTTRRSPVRLGDGWVRRVLRRACGRLNMPTYSPHGFRRAAVNFFIDQGYDAKVIATFLGHSVEVLMEHYRTPTHETVERMVMSARPGDFSTASPARRRALDALPELLRDHALMADPRVRDSLSVLLNALGASPGEDSAQAAAQAERAVPVADVCSAEVSVEADAPAICPSEQLVTHHLPSAAPITTYAPASIPGPAAQPQRRPLPSKPAPTTPTAAQTGPRAHTGEAPLSRPITSSHRQTPPTPGQRPGAGASTDPRVGPPKAPLAASPKRRPSPLEPRHEPQRGPPHTLIDKLAKG